MRELYKNKIFCNKFTQIVSLFVIAESKFIKFRNTFSDSTYLYILLSFEYNDSKFFLGGYGFVFIAQDTSSVKDYALKVCVIILCNIKQCSFGHKVL